MDGLQIIENKVMETLDDIYKALEARFTALENRITVLEEIKPESSDAQKSASKRRVIFR